MHTSQLYIHIVVIIQIFTSSFREKYKIKVTGIQPFTYLKKSVFLRLNGHCEYIFPHCLHAYFSGFQLLIFFNLSGEMFQVLGPRNETLSVPWNIKFTARIVKWELRLRLYGRLLFTNISVIIGGYRALLVLYILIARSWGFLLWIETDTSFFNRSSTDDVLSE